MSRSRRPPPGRRRGSAVALPRSRSPASGMSFRVLVPKTSEMTSAPLLSASDTCLARSDSKFAPNFRMSCPPAPRPWVPWSARRRPRTSRGPHRAGCGAVFRRSGSPSRPGLLPATCARRPRPAASRCRGSPRRRLRRRTVRWTRPDRAAKPPGTSSGSVAGQLVVTQTYRCDRGWPPPHRAPGPRRRRPPPRSGFVGGELQTGEAAHIVAVGNSRAHNSPRPCSIDVGVTDQQGAIPVKVVNVIGLGPIGRVSRRPIQSFQDIGNAGQDQV